MGDSSDSVSIDIETIPFGGKVEKSQYPSSPLQISFLFFSSGLWGSFHLFFCFSFLVLQECLVETSKGSISVFVCGDQEKPAIVTYPDVALNCMFHCLLLFNDNPFLCKLVFMGLVSFRP